MSEDFSSSCISCQLNGLSTLVDFVPGEVVAKTLVDNEQTTVTLMALNKDTMLADCATTGDVVYTCLSGVCVVSVDDEQHELHSNDTLKLEANTPHTIVIAEPTKLMMEINY